MSDLVIGYAVLAALAVGLFLLTASISQGLSRSAVDLVAVLLVCGLFAYIRWLWYNLRLAEWLPMSNLVVVGNWLPLFAAAIAGLVWRRMARRPWRRVATAGALSASAALVAIFPVLGSAPRCGEHWDQLGTCLQTTNHTCSPACAATLLRKYGIAATEQEMARLCLTRRGTSWQGLYRGLKLKTAGTPWDVELCYGDADDLARNYRGPMILSVGLEASTPPNTEFAREFGWIPGVNHSVVLESFNPGGQAVISDPSQEMSREYWDRPMLRTLWRGHAFRLVRRDAH